MDDALAPPRMEASTATIDLLLKRSLPDDADTHGETPRLPAIKGDRPLHGQEMLLMTNISDQYLT
ncbi:hypothetical protein DKM19_05735 [Streptosporangium sp. 'caverna']|nr:hypothetical protein DKM19_05735 [Streptosporangium sp. 'caverna']